MNVGGGSGLREMKVVVVRNLDNSPAVSSHLVVGVTCLGLLRLPLVSDQVSVLPWDSPRQIFTFLIDESRGRQTGRAWDWGLGILHLLPAEPEMLPKVELVEGAGHRYRLET